MLHSKNMVEANKEICEELFDCSQRLATFVIPAEYGLTVKERAGSSLTIISNLVKKVTHDLIWWNSPFIKQQEQIVKDEQSFLEHKGLDSSKVGEDVKSIWRHVRTRLYFTSASHLYSLYNVIALGLKMFSPKSENFRTLLGFTSLDYLSHIMIRLYENLNAKQEDPNRFRLEIMFSQGCKMEKKTQHLVNDSHRVPVANSVVLNSQLTLDEVERFLNGLLELGAHHNHGHTNGASQPEKKAQE
jgi:inositol hexakisphosphate/diphosphoinositol-pentakisphosphate kinase